MAIRQTWLEYDVRQRKHASILANRLNAIYDTMCREAAKIGIGTGFDDPEKEFYLKDFPQASSKVDALLAKMSESIAGLIRQGTEESWSLSWAKNAAMLDKLTSYFGLPKERVEGWSHRNVAALEAFQQRKVNGMGLSERVWDFVKHDKAKLEMALELGLAEGKSAAALSRDVRQYLAEPDKLFRRVRDKDGNLRLSKSAQAYHPGQGVYRSSYKNALRMTITETNMAYRAADHDQWAGIPFVIGQTIKLSNNHTCKGVKGEFRDICDELQGDYPKEFKFVGWHPHCRCYVIAKLPSREEMSKWNRMTDEEQAEYHFEGEVSEVPKGYSDWMEKNAGRIEGAKSVPYFIGDNYPDGEVGKGFVWEQKAGEDNRLDGSGMKANALTDEQRRQITLERAKQRHEARTAEQVEDIKDRWALRQDEMQYSPEQRAMFREIEEKLGIKRGFSMPYLLADQQHANPNYYTGGKPFRVNCQTCAPAYVLREWGFDVTALGNTEKYGNLNYYLSQGNNWRETWLDAKGNKITTVSFKDYAKAQGWKQMNAKRYKQYFDEVCAEDGTYEIGLSWKGRGGHCTIVKRENGVLTYIEPQLDNSPLSSRAWDNIDNLCKSMTVKPWSLDGAIRADNALFNMKYISIFDKNADKSLSSQKAIIDKIIGTKAGKADLHPLRVKPEMFSRPERIRNIEHMRENRRLNANIVAETDTRDGRLFVSLSADNKDIVPNIRVANNLLDAFDDMKVTIRHDFSFDHVKNPEYLINGLLADRKSIETLKGIPSAFKSALEQHCESLVIDLDMHGLKINTRNIYSGINGRRNDFINGNIKECYIVKNGKVIKIDKTFIGEKQKMDFDKIAEEIKKLE